MTRLLLLLSALFVCISSDTVTVKGILLCSNYRFPNATIELLEKDMFPDLDDLLATGKSDQMGEFRLTGTESEITGALHSDQSQLWRKKGDQLQSRNATGLYWNRRLVDVAKVLDQNVGLNVEQKSLAASNERKIAIPVGKDGRSDFLVVSKRPFFPRLHGNVGGSHLVTEKSSFDFEGLRLGRA